MTFKNYYEMKKYHLTRLNFHISLVRKYLQKIIDLNLDDINNSILQAEIEKHDLSKIIEPELTPYCLISWFYKMKQEGIEFKLTEKEEDETHNATVHHVIYNSHHPEYWAEDKTNIIKKGDRDGIQNLCDASKMPLSNVACMVADWLAVSEERGTNALDWADSNINKRWYFTENQIALIYSLIQFFNK